MDNRNTAWTPTILIIFSVAFGVLFAGFIPKNRNNPQQSVIAEREILDKQETNATNRIVGNHFDIQKIRAEHSSDKSVRGTILNSLVLFEDQTEFEISSFQINYNNQDGVLEATVRYGSKPANTAPAILEKK